MVKNKICFFALVYFFILFAHAEELIIAELVEIQQVNPSIQVDLFLANRNNFLGIAIYPSIAKAYAAKEVALELDLIQKELEKVGLGLKIMDAFRPLWAQEKLWEVALTLGLKNPGDYVSDPKTEGGRHPRGTAIDVRLIFLSNGQEVPMPPFGFTEKAHQGYIKGLTEEQIYYRELLKEIMLKHGFTPIRCEWWHYDYKNWQKYKPLNYHFEQM
jgi:zinc D-Ala-D-Ala dipeptidase